ncbi:16S rRNA (cytosine(967)-C(5))-methyltransferase RsmB [Oceanirhabdus seepicola]|uniref:16S rRNA (cytosine(967)-C(5))-methyltransferase n=1 Tax=Oceanirhabdus seepicola TaxID=2828781 RepID=A0A9J6P4J7_9CLOT|nr:16S rRNA (cytosine(967)-C(5))-methyltransferase RsmB [Oceanirhabdus seepicola]MCM1991062.1 16S rRNA (cytosine(967)-C(5))-methyltransferase RsmB [Oceanirhabdus seepicola]
MKNPRYVIYSALNEIINNKSYSNVTINKVLRDKDIKEEDKGLITEVIYGTLRYLYSIDVILQKFLKTGVKKTNKKVLNILRMSIYQIKYLDKIPDYAVIDEAVKISKKDISLKASQLVNGVLRSFMREGFEFQSENRIEELCFQYSYERWLVKLLIGQYGEKRCVDILKGLNFRPSINVRVNTMKKDCESVKKELIHMGYTIEDGKIAKNSIKIVKGASIEKNPLFNEGIISVQDESAMLTVEVMDIKEGMKVLDLCSAPGGKSCYIGERLNNSGEVLAFDVFEKKLKLIEEHAIRLELKNIKAEINDGEKLREDLIDSADIVLADVPCSGLGIIRKKPEIKWTKSKKQLNEIVGIQRNILSNAAKYVKINGELIYSTCTLNRNENDENIRWFLNKNDNFCIESVNHIEGDNIINSNEGFITILPDEKMDGFFICKLKRIR